MQSLKNIIHLVLAFCASIIYGMPGRHMTIIGVTGTDGKTTTSNLIYHILKFAGYKTAVISTTGAVIDGKNYETGFHVTTPSPFDIQRYIKIAKEKGCTHIVLEVTSHALDQNRVWGINFAIGVLTNITHEHLDYHKSYERYVATKLKLLKSAKTSIVNSDGEWFDEVKRVIPKEKLISYSLHGKYDNDLSLLNVPFKINTDLIGNFNLENILAASAVAIKLNVDMTKISEAITTFKLPIGRQQIVKNMKGYMIMIDFAHTPNAFENILSEIRKRTNGRLIHVFGSAGQRDKGKRPEMGKTAAFFDDIIILTAEDPRNENVKDINNAIKGGIGIEFEEGKVDTKDKKGKELFEIEDRRNAIEFALSIAVENDTVIVTGKGHELSMNYGEGEVDWSDQKVIQDFLKR